MNDELKMSVSPICTKDGKKYAFVSFTYSILWGLGAVVIVLLVLVLSSSLWVILQR